MTKGEIFEQLFEVKDHIQGAIESSEYIPLSYFRQYNDLIKHARELNGYAPGEDPEIEEATHEESLH